MIRLPPRSTRTDTLFPYTTLFRSCLRCFSITLAGIFNPALRLFGLKIVRRLGPLEHGEAARLLGQRKTEDHLLVHTGHACLVVGYGRFWRPEWGPRKDILTDGLPAVLAAQTDRCDPVLGHDGDRKGLAGRKRTRMNS